MPQPKKGGGKKTGSRKVGQNKEKCANYLGRHRREHNKEKKLTDHLGRVGSADLVAKEALLHVHTRIPKRRQ